MIALMLALELIAFKDCTALKNQCFTNENNPAKSFVIKAQDSKKVALLIHGLTDSPYSMKDIGLYLNSQGYTVYAPLLTGHGTKPEDLVKTTSAEWMSDVTSSLTSVLKETQNQKALVVGFSMGGALATKLAEQNETKNKISGLILFAPALSIKSIPGKVFCYLGIAEWIQSWARDNPGSTLTNYERMPMHSVCELTALDRGLRAHFSDVTAPVFLAVTEADGTIDVSAALDGVGAMASPTKEIFKIPKKENVQHSDIVYKDDSLYHKRNNPSWDQMIVKITTFLSKI